MEVKAALKNIEKKRLTEGFKCKQCGKCCLAINHVNIHPDDIERWEKEGKHDLYSDKMLVEWDVFGGSDPLDDKCPCLIKNKDKYSCKIYKTRPLFCRTFPLDKKHAKEFCDCKGYEN